jgi:hypothetical protein
VRTIKNSCCTHCCTHNGAYSAKRLSLKRVNTIRPEGTSHDNQDSGHPRTQIRPLFAFIQNAATNKVICAIWASPITGMSDQALDGKPVALSPFRQWFRARSKPRWPAAYNFAYNKIS